MEVTGVEDAPSGDGEAFAAFREGSALLDGHRGRAAVAPLERARDLEPEQGSIREALARAYFAAGRFAEAEAEFAKTVELDPVNDYAHFGLGLCRLRAGDPAAARGHLRVAVAMRPRPEYVEALQRAAAGLS